MKYYIKEFANVLTHPNWLVNAPQDVDTLRRSNTVVDGMIVSFGDGPQCILKYDDALVPAGFWDVEPIATLKAQLTTIDWCDRDTAIAMGWFIEG